jgi:alkanesulfonate monooxygenase SsuD/methylene tetrahydromethanopterin reductase-like flavin-dependent oxidoreductase (luciferase family)
MDNARKVEDLGYSVLSVPDHLTDCLAPIPALAAAAHATKDLRVGTMVPTMTSATLPLREAATLIS